MGSAFLDAMQARVGGQGAPQGGSPMMAAPPQAGGAPGTPVGGLTTEIVKHLQMVNSLLAQLVESGEPIDPNLIAPHLQEFGQNMAILAARDSADEVPGMGGVGAAPPEMAGPPGGFGQGF